MPNIESAIKRVRTTEKSNELNAKQLSSMRTAIKKFEKAIEVGSDDVAELQLAANRAIDMAETKGLIHKNKANRTKSRLHAKLAKKA
ncbi:30S ribosomal protein S20 [Vagococcus humatus]|uniref:Small ribosomal subunit protein bS20 n=1 Tax=Vagococcus humatus TaxID=1889241 RepID=A0A429Z4T9_9ENTE|nr:30S ribosomal protein S20 [Vagococcus humatus]RST88708.1 30S ribosomal protein S20 [Vagococcus humatus]